MLRELHASRSHSIDIGRGELLLPIATEVAIAGIINHDENEIWFLGRLSREGEQGYCKEENNFLHRVKVSFVWVPHVRVS